VPPAAEPEAEPRPEPLSAAEFRAQLDQIVRDSQRSPEPEPEPEAEPEAADSAAMYAEIHEDLQHIGRQIDELAARGAEADARRAEAQQEILDEPPERQAQAQAILEASWDPGVNGGRPEPGATAEAEDAEPEMEI
jgi:hypothetical protein